MGGPNNAAVGGTAAAAAILKSFLKGGVTAENQPTCKFY